MRYALAAFALIVSLDSGRLYAACTDGTQASGAKYRICLPSGTWNKQLVVYAHGYVSSDQPVAIPEDQLVVDGTSLPDTFTAFGYAFAVSSYRANGLVILEAQDDGHVFGAAEKFFQVAAQLFLRGKIEGFAGQARRGLALRSCAPIFSARLLRERNRTSGACACRREGRGCGGRWGRGRGNRRRASRRASRPGGLSEWIRCLRS